MILLICIVTPLLVEYWIPIPSGKGDWLGFWGSYLGVIPSGLIAYFVAKYQIDREHEISKLERDKEYLPYFNIKQGELTFSSVQKKLPVRSLEIMRTMDHGFLLKLKRAKKNFFPGEVEHIDIHSKTFKHVAITCMTLNGTRIFYIYGDGVQGAHFVKIANKKWEQYVFEETDDVNQLAWNRLKKSDIYKK